MEDGHLSGGYIALIVIASVWLVCLVIFAILAYKYQKKHNAYVAVRKEYEDKFKELEQNKNINELLLPIKTNIKLPKDENFYDIEHNVSCYITEKKKHRSKKKTSQRMKRRKMMEDYNEYYGVISLKDVYGWKKEYKKHKYPDLRGDLFITNKRVLLKEKKDIEEIELSAIKSFNPTVVYIQGEFVPGFAIVTDNDIYQFINDDPTVIIIIRELIKRNK